MSLKITMWMLQCNATMQTMTKEPYVHHVPMMTGGVGYQGVHNFYKNHFIGKMPADTKIVGISRTIGKDQVVDELIVSFTHDREVEYMLPGVSPTGKYITLPHVVIMNFKDGRILPMNTYTGIKHPFLFKSVYLIQDYCL
jgi:carboxymethylenebutenolidase